DDLLITARRSVPEQALPFLGEVPWADQFGRVRDDAHAPVGGVGGRGAWPYGRDLGGDFALVSGRKWRARLGRWHAAEVGRQETTLGREEHPGATEWVLAEQRHDYRV